MPAHDELAYALITPYSLHKSRTGGILARLLWANVRLVAARMYAPRADSDFVERYCDAIYDPRAQRIPLHFQKLLIRYVVDNFGRPNRRGISNRLAVLFFRGPDALRDIAEAVGHLGEHVRGDNVRGTYGDFFRERPAGSAGGERTDARQRLLDRYDVLRNVAVDEPGDNFFEPAVLTGVTPEMNDAHLRLFRDRAYSEGGFVLDALDGVDKETFETSMVILKPESFHHRNPLPGNLIDFFSRVGMYITGMKMLELGLKEASEFYSLKLPQFREQLKGMVADRARCAVERARLLARQASGHLAGNPHAAGFPANVLSAAREAERVFCAEPGPGQVKPHVVDCIYEELTRRLHDLAPPDSLYDELAEGLKDLNARAEFDELIRYMTGKDPRTGVPIEQGEETSCMALLYSGPGALGVIRRRLKDLRTVYGQNVLLNRAHASDPDEDPVKELEVLGMPASPSGESRPCDVERVVNEFCGTE